MWFEVAYNEYNPLLASVFEEEAYGPRFNPASFVGNSTSVVSLLQRVSENLFKWITKIFGKCWIVKFFVDFLRVLHFEQVGISSPSNISSLMKESRQSESLQRVFEGNDTLKSQNGSKVVLVFPHSLKYYLRWVMNWIERKNIVTYRYISTLIWVGLRTDL